MKLHEMTADERLFTLCWNSQRRSRFFAMNDMAKQMFGERYGSCDDAGKCLRCGRTPKPTWDWCLCVSHADNDIPDLEREEYQRLHPPLQGPLNWSPGIVLPSLDSLIDGTWKEDMERKRPGAI